MRLHAYEWGDPDGPPLVCLHGVTGHAERFRRLAVERWSDRRVIALDLRGHGRSGWEPPWSLPTHVADLAETAAGLGLGEADWAGHSLGGRLVLELAAAHPALVRRAVLLDPAIHVLPHVSLQSAEAQIRDPVYASADEFVAERLLSDPQTDRALAAEDAAQYLEPLPDGRLRRRTCQAAVATLYGEIAAEPPPPASLRCPVLLVYAPDYGLVRPEQIAAYEAALGERLRVVPVPGMHMVMWDAFEETAAAVGDFLR
jgi:lipase